jgi:hypothetical protein
MANLCALSDIHAWLAIPTAQVSDDTLISSLIGNVSTDFLNEIKRPDFYPAQVYNEVREGDGGDLMVLRHWPLNSIVNLSLIDVGSPPSLTGSSIEQASETYTLGASPPVTSIAVVNAADFMHDGAPGSENSLGAVVNAVTGLPLAFVSQGTLQAGQYSVHAATGTYAFSLADAQAGIAVTITYTWFNVGDLQPIPESTNDVAPGWWIDADVDPERRYELYLDGKVYTFLDQREYSITYNAGYATVPPDAAQAVIEWTSQRYKGRQAIGQTQKHMSTGDSVSTPESEIPASVKRVIERYRRYDPLQTPPERVPLLDMGKKMEFAKARKR